MIDKNILMATIIDDEDNSNCILIREYCDERHLMYRDLYRSFTEIKRPYYLGLDILNSLNIHYKMLGINYCSIEVI